LTASPWSSTAPAPSHRYGAALVCRLTQALGHHLGLLQPAIYANAADSTDAVSWRLDMLFALVLDSPNWIAR